MSSRLSQKTKRTIVLTFLIASIGIAVVVLFPISPPQNDEPPTVVTIKPSNNPKEEIGPQTPERKAETNKLESEDEILSQEFRDELGEVADLYEQQIRYPHYSQPISDIELALTPKPFSEAKVDNPLPTESGEPSPIGISASVDKIRYVSGEPITVQLIVTGTAENTQIVASVNFLQTSGETILTSDKLLTPFAESNREYRATVDSGLFEIISSELLARIEINVDDTNYVTTVPFWLSHSSGRLENIGFSQQAGSFLRIPLEYSVKEAGYFFVDAVLDDAATGRPLVRLQTEGRMPIGNQQLTLNAHQQALKDAGSEGPYRLRIMRSYRGAELNENYDVPTSISSTWYDIPRFEFSNYDSSPFSDPEAEERLEALRSLSNSGSGG